VLYTYKKGYPKDKGSFTPYAFLMFVVLFGNFFLLQTFLALLIGNFQSSSEKVNQERLAEKRARKERQKKNRKKTILRKLGFFGAIKACVFNYFSANEKKEEPESPLVKKNKKKK